jgi:hypothetical protein
LTTQDSLIADATRDLVWHKQVPLKVSILAWRLLKDMLPTRMNLFRRGILQAEEGRCVTGCGSEETATHLFLHCEVFGLLWYHVRLCIGVSGVDPHNISEHFFQFTYYTGHSKARRSFLQLIWLLCIWLLWKERNNRLFNNIETPIFQLLDQVKFHSLWWLKARNGTCMHGFQRWWSDPLLYLGLD